MKLAETAAALEAKMIFTVAIIITTLVFGPVCTQLVMELNWSWMTETSNLFHASFSLNHLSLIILAGKGWRACLSTMLNQMFSMGDTSGDHSN